MKQDIVNEAVLSLQKTEIFHTADTGVLKRYLESDSEICVYKRGEAIFSEENYKPALGFLLRGTARVKKGKANINMLKAGDLFGAVALFGEFRRYATEITANSECKVIFLSREIVRSLMAQSNTIAESYIKYLSQRIYFLTGKIEAFTAGTSEERLANYLLKSSNNSGTVKEVKVDNLSFLAKELDIGRASLYRTLDGFILAGAIKREGKRILLLDMEKLIHFKY